MIRIRRQKLYYIFLSMLIIGDEDEFVAGRLNLETSALRFDALTGLFGSFVTSIFLKINTN